MWVNLECFGEVKVRFIRHDRAKRMCWCKQQKVAPAELPARAERGHSSRPDLDIPRWVARQQSPTPFHQAGAIVARCERASSIPRTAREPEAGAFFLPCHALKTQTNEAMSCEAEKDGPPRSPETVF